MNARAKILFAFLGCVIVLCIVLYDGLREKDTGYSGYEDIDDTKMDQGQQRGQENHNLLAPGQVQNGRRLISNPASVVAQSDPSIEESQSKHLFSGNSVVESFKSRAKKFGWSYDDLANNINLWNKLCGSTNIDNSSFASSNTDRIDNDIVTKMMKLCSGFNDWKTSEGKEFIDVYSAEAISGQTLYHSMLSELVDLDQRKRLESVSRHLNRAISQLNEAALVDLLGYLAFSDFGRNSLGGERAEISNQYGVSQIMAASSILICEQIGGCGHEHLLTIRTCKQFPQRFCERPENIYDAIYQQFTGLEWDRLIEFLHRVNAVRVQSD